MGLRPSAKAMGPKATPELAGKPLMSSVASGSNTVAVTLVDKMK